MLLYVLCGKGSGLIIVLYHRYTTHLYCVLLCGLKGARQGSSCKDASVQVNTDDIHEGERNCHKLNNHADPCVAGRVAREPRPARPTSNY